MKLPVLNTPLKSQNECEISPNLNKIDHNDSSKNVQLSWLSEEK